MALNAYLNLVGQKQGQIKSSVIQKGREGAIMVIAFNHEVTCPLDPMGRVTGKRQHSPLTILKEIDAASPALMRMLITGERTKLCELRFWQPSATGAEIQHFTIALKNASIMAIRQEMLNNKYPENSLHKEREFVTFAYEGIRWTHEVGQQTCEDTWTV